MKSKYSWKMVCITKAEHQLLVHGLRRAILVTLMKMDFCLLMAERKISLLQAMAEIFHRNGQKAY